MSLPFTKQDVIDAYKRHPEIKPERRKFVAFHYGDDGKRGAIKCACAASIVAINNGHEAFVREMLCDVGTREGAHRLAPVLASLEDIHDVSLELFSLARGFDGASPDADERENPAQVAAYQLGCDIAEAIFEDGVLGEHLVDL